MNILWLTNIPLPEVSELMGSSGTSLGGWLVNSSRFLADTEGIQLSITFPVSGNEPIKTYNGRKINYYPFHRISYIDIDKGILDARLLEVLELVRPDFVHIYGTEFAHSLAMVNVCKTLKVPVVVSIQGLVSIYAHHYMGFLSAKDQKKRTLRDLVKRSNLFQQQQEYYERGKYEIEAIKKADYIIGRTTWDKACTMQINPESKYHFCNETLRESFYEAKWSIEKCNSHTIFLSQGIYPIKGFHLMIEALPLILNRFPDTKVVISGPNLFKTDTWFNRLKKTGFAQHIVDRIRDLNLENIISFTGMLDEIEMRDAYLRTHVFVCPSSIENSPNSLGEAMLLGVPCVSADVGGVTDMMTHRVEGFAYPADEYYMLAHYVCEIFGNPDLAKKLSENARIHAAETHHRQKNLQQLLSIYSLIEKS